MFNRGYEGSHADVAKHRFETELAQWRYSSRKCACGRNHFIARFKTRHQKSENIRTASTVAKNAKLFPKISANFVLELSGTRTRCEPAVLQTFCDCIDLFLTVRFKFIRRVPDGFRVLLEFSKEECCQSHVCVDILPGCFRAEKHTPFPHSAEAVEWRSKGSTCCEAKQSAMKVPESRRSMESFDRKFIYIASVLTDRHLNLTFET